MRSLEVAARTCSRAGPQRAELLEPALVQPVPVQPVLAQPVLARRRVRPAFVPQPS
jgi:hypothetical protein